AFDEWLPELTRQLAESADAHDRSGDFPQANLALLRHHGLLALALPPALGGPGASLGFIRAHVLPQTGAASNQRQAGIGGVAQRGNSTL
ncbi:hypothetical protein KFU42_25290, partial [Escherichia coli]|nr:hypothetical protein [Escherichia coli]